MANAPNVNTSVAAPALSTTAELKLEETTPPVQAPGSCSSRNCIHKSQDSVEEVEEKKSKKTSKTNKSKKRKQKQKEESDSGSSDSDDSNSSSSSSESEVESSDSESSEDEEETRKSTKSRSKSKKASKQAKRRKDKKKSNRTKNKKLRRTKDKDEDEEDSSASSESSDEESESESASDDVSSMEKLLEEQGLFKNPKTKLLLRKLLKRAAQNDGGDILESKKTEKFSKTLKGKKRKPSTSAKKSKKKEKTAKEVETEEEVEQQKVDTDEDPSKSKYKRIDEIWDEGLYDYRLKETSEQAATDEYDRYVFTVRRKFDCENHYQSTVVDIKSESLKDCLKIVLEDVPGVSVVESTPRLSPELIFLYLEDLRAYNQLLKDRRKKCKDKVVKQSLKTKFKHLELLIGYIDKDYDELKKRLCPMLKNGTITFELLWVLYKPNTLAYKAMYGDESQPHVFKIEYATKERDYTRGFYYDIEGKYMDYDGEKFGWAFVDAEVVQFQGARRITSLPCYPLKYHQKDAATRAQLIERGKKFLSLAGMNYKVAKGTSYIKKENKALKVNVNGRVMIDPKTFRRINPNYALAEVEPRDVENESDECRCEKPDQPRLPQKGSGLLYMIEKRDESEVEVIEMEPTDPRAPDNLTDLIKRTEVAKNTFTEEELLMTSPLLPGFSFSEKLWVELAVSTIFEVQWNSGAFDSLVIPEKHKSIVKALVSSHRQHASKSIDDVVSGKGKGLVAVLHGKPGLGKTLTCEAVSDLLKRPLYAVSAGDLGTSATTLEYQLQTILDVAHTWGAVLLLDEADVFLEERSSRDVHRNAMVSIFLRLLEYHAGILILTTNRVETFDEAFVSRIHLSLRYGDLTVQARKAIWKTFIKKVAESANVPVTAEQSYTVLSEPSTTGITTPDTTSSTPNSGAATPAPSVHPSEEQPPTPTSLTSIASADSDKTTTQAFSEDTATDSAPSDTLPDPAPVIAVEKITEADYLELSRIDLNGRQIKNLVKTAQALALYEGVPMAMSHLRRCIEVGRSFEMDLKGGRGWEDVMRSYT